MPSFATSARAVDMLGRQQIASVPTAISELFKNAYDAYAKRVRADYSPDADSLLLTDDGVGMSLDDFTTRWMVLATDSKTRDSRSPRPPRPANSTARPTMGEKGIGRLAIAALGPQALIVTRRTVGLTAAPMTVVSLVQWAMFEIPGLLLEEVDVPVLTISAPWPTQAHVEQLVDQVRANLSILGVRAPETARQRIEGQLAGLIHSFMQIESNDPIPMPTTTSGTSFLISPVRDELAALIRTTSPRGESRSTDFERLLVGFTNTMLPDSRPSPMRAAFYVHGTKASENLMSPEVFWQPEDFDHADHDISGTFDERGTFHGTVSVYGAPPQEYTVPFAGLGSRGTSRCGPFDIRIGYLQGDPKESRLAPEEYLTTQAKLTRIGGLYIYRDGIRVLPYGSADVDYLGIEERRSRNAGRYYFSYRRMFGAVEISAEANAGLRDKASREGLLDNLAFREFRAILENFFIQTASDFFRSTGPRGEAFSAERARLREQDVARRRAAKTLAAAAESYMSQLEQRRDLIEGGRAQEAVDSEVDAYRAKLVEQGSTSASELAELESAAIERIRAIADSTALNTLRPSSLSDEQVVESIDFEYRLDMFNTDVLIPAMTIVRSVTEKHVPAGSDNDLRSRRDQAYWRTANSLLDDFARLTGEVRAETARLEAAVSEELATREETALGEAKEMLDHAPTRGGQGAALASLQESMRRHHRAVERLRTRVRASSDDTEFETNELLKGQLARIEAASDRDIDLILLGQAVQIIDHELEHTIGRARNSLSAAYNASAPGSQVRAHVDAASTAFAHLDGYLRLFTPLQRRLRRQRVDITGTRIVTFIDSLHAAQLDAARVELRATRRFRKSTVHGFPSTFLPVFANLVDNAIYWAERAHPDGGGVVELDLDLNADLLVRDNGPGVTGRDRDVVFERGFTRKPAGRGLGLSISKEALAQEGWGLSVDPPGSSPASGAVFRIHRH